MGSTPCVVSQEAPTEPPATQQGYLHYHQKIRWVIIVSLKDSLHGLCSTALPNTKSTQVLKCDGAKMDACLTPAFTWEKLDISPLHFRAVTLQNTGQSVDQVLAGISQTCRWSQSNSQYTESCLTDINIICKDTWSKLALGFHQYLPEVIAFSHEPWLLRSLRL